MTTRIRQAVILAGGRGERLRPLTDNFPKPMVPVNGRPFLEYLVDLLKRNGIVEIVLLLGYLPDMIMDHFGDGADFGVKIRYSVGAVEDETATRVRNARDMLDDVFLLMYCDNYWPLDLADMERHYRRSGLLGMMTVYNNTDGKGEYGFRNNVELDARGCVLAYGPTPGSAAIQGVDIGFFILNRETVALLPAHNCSIQNDLLPRLIEKGQLAAYRTDRHYHTITTPGLLKNIERILEGEAVRPSPVAGQGGS